MGLRSIDIYTMSLFPELRAARSPAPTPKIKGARTKGVSAAEEDPLLTIRQRTRKAWKGLPQEAKAALSSVFDLATKTVCLRTGSMERSAGEGGNRYASRIQPTRGVTRIEGAAYPSRWTEADHRREEQRRARQRPPRPVAKAKTRGKIVREADGEAVD